MIVDILFLLLKIFGVLMVVIITKAVLKHMKIQSDIKRLEKEGIFSYPGNDKFLAGPIVEALEEKKKRMKESVQPSDAPYMLKLMCEKDRKPGDPPFDAKKYPMVVLNFAGLLSTLVADPDVV